MCRRSSTLACRAASGVAASRLAAARARRAARRRARARRSGSAGSAAAAAGRGRRTTARAGLAPARSPATPGGSAARGAAGPRPGRRARRRGPAAATAGARAGRSRSSTAPSWRPADAARQVGEGHAARPAQVAEPLPEGDEVQIARREQRFVVRKARHPFDHSGNSADLCHTLLATVQLGDRNGDNQGSSLSWTDTEEERSVGNSLESSKQPSLAKEWATNPRWKGVTRNYTRRGRRPAARRGPGGAHPRPARRRAAVGPASHEDYINSLGALTGNQAVQQVRPASRRSTCPAGRSRPTPTWPARPTPTRASTRPTRCRRSCAGSTTR